MQLTCHPDGPAEALADRCKAVATDSILIVSGEPAVLCSSAGCWCDILVSEKSAETLALVGSTIGSKKLASEKSS